MIAGLLGEPGVAILHDTNGRWDLLAEWRAPNLQELGKVLERIRLLKVISNTETSIHLETFRVSRSVLRTWRCAYSSTALPLKCPMRSPKSRTEC